VFAGNLLGTGSMKEKRRDCIRCGGKMIVGMLPGWWNCACGFFLDIQDCGSYQIVQYSRFDKGQRGEVISVPAGCLLIMQDKEV